MSKDLSTVTVRVMQRPGENLVCLRNSNKASALALSERGESHWKDRLWLDKVMLLYVVGCILSMKESHKRVWSRRATLPALLYFKKIILATE